MEAYVFLKKQNEEGHDLFLTEDFDLILLYIYCYQTAFNEEGLEKENLAEVFRKMNMASEWVEKGLKNLLNEGLVKRKNSRYFIEDVESFIKRILLTVKNKGEVREGEIGSLNQKRIGLISGCLSFQIIPSSHHKKVADFIRLFFRESPVFIREVVQKLEKEVLCKGIVNTEPKFHQGTGSLIFWLYSCDISFARLMARKCNLGILAENIGKTVPRYHSGTARLIFSLYGWLWGFARKVVQKIENALVKSLEATVPEYHLGTARLIYNLNVCDRDLAKLIVDGCDSEVMGESIGKTSPELHFGTGRLLYAIYETSPDFALKVVEKSKEKLPSTFLEDNADLFPNELKEWLSK